MNTIEYIKACKEKLGVDTNYKLANELCIDERNLNFYSRGERVADAYACFKFGECLGIDPQIIIADIASEAEKNPKKRDYFKTFMSRCAKAVAALILTTALLNSTNEETAFAV